jgi:hypothetical protein
VHIEITRETSLRHRLFCFIIGLGAVGCGGSGSAISDDRNSPGSDVGDPQTPPRGQAVIEPWLAQGFYLSWKCEPASHPSGPFGAHGENRVCSNDLLSAAGAGEFRVGSASVKEIYSGAGVVGYSVSRHTSSGTSGNTWYWYERIGSGAATDSQGAGVCVSCHRQAGNQRQGHDYVYTQVR